MTAHSEWQPERQPDVPLTAQHVTAWIVSKADTRDIELVIAAVKDRQRALRTVRAAAVTVGARVEITNISPKYLSGIKGTVESIDGGKYGTVRIDPEFSWQARGKDRNGLLTGMPLSCLAVL